MKKLIPILLLAVFNINCSTKKSQITQQQQPNIVLILADDMGFSDIGAFGSAVKVGEY
jgi:arylsulfatase